MTLFVISLKGFMGRYDRYIADFVDECLVTGITWCLGAVYLAAKPCATPRTTGSTKTLAFGHDLAYDSDGRI